MDGPTTSPGEEGSGPLSRMEGSGSPGPLGGRSLYPKLVFEEGLFFMFIFSEKRNMRVILAGSGEEEVKSGENLHGYR